MKNIKKITTLNMGRKLKGCWLEQEKQVLMQLHAEFFNLVCNLCEKIIK